MSKQRYINTKLWDDGFITTLDPTEKLLFIYFLTNPLTNISGIYEITLKRISFDTGIESSMVEKIIDRFEKNHKIKFDNNWIAIKNFVKHQAENPKIMKGIEKCLEIAPKPLSEWVNSPIPDSQSRPIDSLSKPLNYININYNTNSNAPLVTKTASKITREKTTKKPMSLGSITRSILVSLVASKSNLLTKDSVIAFNSAIKRIKKEHQNMCDIEVPLLANYLQFWEKDRVIWINQWGFPGKENFKLMYQDFRGHMRRHYLGDQYFDLIQGKIITGLKREDNIDKYLREVQKRHEEQFKTV